MVNGSDVAASDLRGYRRRLRDSTEAEFIWELRRLTKQFARGESHDLGARYRAVAHEIDVRSGGYALPYGPLDDDGDDQIQHPADTDWGKVPLHDLEFTGHSRRRLATAGIETVGELLCYSRRELSVMPSVGIRTVRDVTNVLRMHGLRLGEASDGR